MAECKPFAAQQTPINIWTMGSNRANLSLTWWIKSNQY